MPCAQTPRIPRPRAVTRIHQCSTCTWTFSDPPAITVRRMLQVTLDRTVGNHSN